MSERYKNVLTLVENHTRASKKDLKVHGHASQNNIKFVLTSTKKWSDISRKLCYSIIKFWLRHTSKVGIVQVNTKSMYVNRTYTYFHTITPLFTLDNTDANLLNKRSYATFKLVLQNRLLYRQKLKLVQPTHCCH